MDDRKYTQPAEILSFCRSPRNLVCNEGVFVYMCVYMDGGRGGGGGGGGGV